MGLMTINVGWAIISLKTKIHLWFALSSVLVFCLQDCQQEVIVLKLLCKNFGCNPPKGIL